MDSLYTPEVKRIIYDTKWPKGLAFDVVERDGTLLIRFYRDNFDELPDRSRLIAAEQTASVINKVRQMGCPCYFEVLANVPR